MQDAWLEKHGFKNAGTWPEVSSRDWRSWKWQFAHRMMDLGTLEKRTGLTREQRTAMGQDLGLPVAVTPYYAALIASSGSTALRRMALPLPEEAMDTDNAFDDPLAEEAHSPVPGLVHRYPDRVLLSVTATCPLYCRYCTRRRYVGRPHHADPNAWWDYLGAHTEVREVIVSGGEPMTLADPALQRLLSRVRANEHVQVIRLSTRTPAVLPCRITDRTAQMLAEFQPLFVLTQFNHPAECTLEAFHAVQKLRMAGIPVLNQMVLLSGVNDNAGTIAELGRRLLVMGVKPYYLHQMDAVKGTAHFRVALDRGIAIMRELRRSVSGIATPKYVIDLPQGGGKVALAPNYVVEYSGTRAWLAGTDDRLHMYEWPEPGNENTEKTREKT